MKQAKTKKGKKTQTWAILLILLCTLVIAIGQPLLKIGADRLDFHPLELITNYALIIGCIAYFAAAVMLIIALKGGEVSVLYPIFATSYIWVTLVAKYFLHETISAMRWTGLGIVIVGVIIISFGGE